MEHLCIVQRQEVRGKEIVQQKTDCKKEEWVEMNGESKEKTERKQREERNACMRESSLPSSPGKIWHP